MNQLDDDIFDDGPREQPSTLDSTPDSAEASQPAGSALRALVPTSASISGLPSCSTTSTVGAKVASKLRSVG